MPCRYPAEAYTEEANVACEAIKPYHHKVGFEVGELLVFLSEISDILP